MEHWATVRNRQVREPQMLVPAGGLGAGRGAKESRNRSAVKQSFSPSARASYHS